MCIHLTTRIKRALWAATGSTLAVLCANPVWANGIITPASRYDGGRLSVQTQTGSNCSSAAPDRASVSAVAGTRDRSFTGGYSSGSQDLVAGVAVSIPFGGPALEDCNGLLRIEEARNRIDLAVTLFEAGAMTADEFKAIMEEAKAVLRDK